MLPLCQKTRKGIHTFKPYSIKGFRRPCNPVYTLNNISKSCKVKINKYVICAYMTYYDVNIYSHVIIILFYYKGYTVVYNR